MESQEHKKATLPNCDFPGKFLDSRKHRRKQVIITILEKNCSRIHKKMVLKFLKKQIGSRSVSILSRTGCPTHCNLDFFGRIPAKT